MKKIIFAASILVLISSCSVFRRTPKTGCPTSGAAIGAEQLASGDPKALKASSRSKYKGRKNLK